MNIQRALIIGVMIILSGCEFWNSGSRQTFSGTLEISEHVLGAKTAGRLATLSVDEGSQVKKGDLLATLDRYEQAKKDYERAVTLFNDGGATRQAVEYAQLAVDDQTVVSPVDGVVLVKVREQGEVVGAGSAIVVVGDRSRYWVRIFVPQGAINRLRMEQAAKIKLDGLDESFSGRVSFIASKAEFTPRNVQTAEERVTQTFAVKVTFDNPPDYLRPGVACDVTFDLNGH